MASKRLGALLRIKRGAQGRGCGREGSGALPLARAAAVSTGLRVLDAAGRMVAPGVQTDAIDALVTEETIKRGAYLRAG